jgi:DNA-binding NarL/FixJ family response regulator
VAALMPRQREVLQLLAEGRSAKDPGGWPRGGPRRIPARTVEFHKYQMTETLGIRSNAELVHFAIQHGLVGL